MIAVLSTSTESATAGSTPGPGRSCSWGARRRGEPRGGEHPGGGDDGQVEQPVGHVAVVDVGELVGDHEADLVALEVLQQVVVEDDALRAPQAGDVGVGAGRPAAGVDLVDLADVDAGLAREREHVGARAALGQRGEPVEDRVQDDRRRVRRGHAEGDDERRGGQPPAARGAAHERHARAGADAGEDGPDPPRLDQVAGPLRPALGRQPDVDGALAGDRAQRQGHDLQGHREHRPGARRGQHRPREAAAQGARRPGHEPHEDRSLDAEDDQPDDALRPAEVLGALDLLGGEVAGRVDRGRLDHAVARAQQQHGGLGHDERGYHGQRRPPTCAVHGHSMACGACRPRL